MPSKQTAKQVSFEGKTSLSDKGMQALGSYGQYVAFKGIENSKIKEPVGPKLAKLREEMKEEGLDALIERATDEYLNERFDKDPAREMIYISNFDGLTGEILITPEKAHIIVDGNYHKQADKQVDNNYYTVQKIGMVNPYDTKMLSLLVNLSKHKPIKVGYDPNKFNIQTLKSFKKRLAENGANVKLVPTSENLVNKIRGGKPIIENKPLQALPLNIVGESAKEKLVKLTNKFDSLGIDGLIVTNLTDIAYITNLRGNGNDIECNSSFKAKAFVSKDKTIVFCDPKKVTPEIRKNLEGAIEFKPEEDFTSSISKFINSSDKQMKIGVSSETTTEATYKQLEKLTRNKAKLVEIEDNPVLEMRVIKNDVELKTLQDAFTKADRVTDEVIRWLNKEINTGKKVTEKELTKKVEAVHIKYGADALSFPTITAIGVDNDIVNYREEYSDKVINKGDPIILDHGAFYNGYSTDLTRTFLAGGDEATPTDQQKEVYTVVVKGALHGLHAEIPPGKNGKYLDNLVKSIIREKGKELGKKYGYGNSTIHGIGVACHEVPPWCTKQVDADPKKTRLSEGMVIAIEPGIYIENWNGGGVGFENLVKIVKHHDPAKAKEGWREIECMTFAPIDHNLINVNLLTDQEKEWLKEFDAKTKEVLM